MILYPTVIVQYILYDIHSRYHTLLTEGRLAGRQYDSIILQ